MTATVDPKVSLDRVLQAAGGALKLEAIDEVFRPLFLDTKEGVYPLVDRINEINTKPDLLPPIELGFLDTDTPEAFVEECNGAFVIVISAGIVEQIYGTLLGLMTDPEFFTHVGQPGNEKRREETFSGGFPPFPIRTASDPKTKSVAVLLPQCRLRKTYAFMVAQQALDFLMIHECAHVFGGHFEYFKPTSDFRVISEKDLGLPTSELTLDRVLMEVDADAFGCDVAATVYVNETMGQMVLDEGLVRDRDALSASAEAWALGALVVLRLFGSHATRADPMVAGSYAHPAVRSIMLIQHLMWSKQECRPAQWSVLIESFKRALHEVETACVRFRLPGFRVYADEEWNQGIQEACSTLFAKFHGRLPELRKHSKVVIQGDKEVV